MSCLKEFLESSTIHGLVYISTSKSKSQKILWFLIVFVSFSIAIFLINSSYSSWNSSPISSVITTVPIAELPFPKITVCPPKDLNTVLNYDLFKANESLTEEEKQQLLKATFDIFIEPQLEKARILSNLYNEENLQDCYLGIQNLSLPQEGKLSIQTKATS